ncbi:MAG TPA: YkgJ family cysteine cluster protein [Kofleriaceae bacterium]|nr:YkgJ family cysteine cluster protein [Kofleriaceae bacterium]
MERAYFTWPDRRFQYECRGCGACCKGHGIGLDVAGGQLVQLIARRPEIVPFLRRRGEAITAFNPRDRCWFLDDVGLCRIELEDGRAAKPASCRLFPFNRVFRLGSYTIVDYNSVLCPLTVTQADGAAAGIAHADVLAEIEAIADPSIVGTALPARDAEAEGREFVATERAIAAAAFAATATAAADPAAALAAAWGAQADAGALEAERAAADAALRVIAGASWRMPSGATLAAALWLTPSMRFNELYGPRQYAPRSAMPPVLVRMWLAWLGFAALGEVLAGRSLGLQELTTLWSEQAPLMHAVARWTEAPALKPGPAELPGVDPGGLVRRLGQAFVDNRKAKRPLAELVERLGADPAARVAALKSADALLRAGFAR